MPAKAGSFWAEPGLCPPCGERRGKRAGVRNGIQNYLCQACGRWWRGGAPPEPPDRTCPYCKGHCQKAGITYTKGRQYAVTPLQQWLGYERPKPTPVQVYLCTICGRINRELWPDPTPKGKAWGPCRFYMGLLLNSESEEALVAYCRKHKLRFAEAVRTIFREASYARFGMGGRVYGKPPELPADTPMPPLPDGRVALTERKRGKLWGHREVIIVRRLGILLDAVSYRGLSRTMAAKKMTRQEAARYLIIGTLPRCVGMAAERD